jgi:carbamoyl-phosphate synthase large subunit
VQCTEVNKVTEGRPHIVDMLKNDEITLIVNTTEGKQAIADSYTIRRTALQRKVSYTTTMAGARALVLAMKEVNVASVNQLQDLHKGLVA